LIYLYEDSFINLLNLINYLFKNKIKPINIKNEYYEPNLLEDVFYPKLEIDKNLCDRIINKIGIYSFRIICNVYLSNYNDKELLIYEFLFNSLKYGNRICYMRNLDCVSTCLKISKYVMHEGHKFKGFVRFKELDNKVLYSEIEPENNIIFILSNHFKNRLKNEYWIIKDNKRNILSVYNKKNYDIFYDTDFNINIKEDYYEDLWKTFYNTVGIKERKNDRC